MYICTIFFFKLTWNSFKKQCCAALLPYIKSYFTTSTYCSGINFAYILLYVDCCIVTFWKKSSGIWKWAWCRLEMAIRGNLTYTFFPVGWSIQLIWQNWWTCPSHTHTFLQWRHCFSTHSNFHFLFSVKWTYHGKLLILLSDNIPSCMNSPWLMLKWAHCSREVQTSQDLFWKFGCTVQWTYKGQHKN